MLSGRKAPETLRNQIQLTLCGVPFPSGVQKREEKVPAPSCLLPLLYSLLCLFDFKTAIM